MRHRIGIAAMTGLGNPNQELLKNKGNLTKDIKKMLDEAIKLYFSKWGGVDFDIQDDYINFGIEPAYQHEHLLIINLRREKYRSSIERGVAWGAWGSEIASTIKSYGEYKTKSKFVKFIDKWHGTIFNPSVN